MPPAPIPSLAFEDIVIDFAGRRLARAGEAQTLEPKAFDVLALLAASPGQAFTRDQILDAVWGHRHVTPGVLNRVMTLLRHALGEDASAPRYLHTLHGIGYRFDLPTALGENREPTSNSGATAPGAIEETGHSPVPLMAPTAALRSKLWSWWPIALAAAAFGAAFLVWNPSARVAQNPAPHPAGKPAALPVLIVMPLTPIGDQESGRDIAAGLSDELITELAMVPGLQVIARESTALATAGQADVAGLVPRLGISHALEGSLRQAGEQLRVHVRLTEARTGKTLWAQDYDRKAEDVLALQRDIARSVATTLALELGLGSEPKSKGADAGYLRRYFAARARLRTVSTTSGDRVERIETEFRTLLRERPDDARVHAALAMVLEARAFVRPPLAEQLRAEALGEAELALRLDPRSSDAWRVKAGSACRAEQWESCLSWIGTASRLAPGESEPRLQYAMELATLGYLDRAEVLFRRGLRSDPLNVNWQLGLGRVLDTLGRHDEAFGYLRDSGDRAVYGLWFNAVWRGDLAEAMRRAESLDTATPTREYERILKPSYINGTRALQDPRLWPEARKSIAEFERSTGLMNFIRVFDPEADPGKLIFDLQEVRRRSYSSWDLLIWSRDLPFLRTHRAFQEALRRNGMLVYWQKHGFPSQCRPTAEGANCK